MIKKILTIFLCIMISITILIVGCEKKDVINSSEETNTKEDIQADLEENKNIDDITWSYDKSKVAYTKDIGDYMKQLYVWKVGEENEKKIEGVNGNLHGISWSFDNSYITVNEGTSSLKNTIIISSEDLQVYDTVENAGGPIWAPNSEKIAFAVINDIEPIIPIEFNGTRDIMIYNINLMTKIVVIYAENDYLYLPISWDGNGLKYEKNYLDDRESEELVYEDVGYDIITEVYTAKSKNMEENIKYPVVKNMINKDNEEKINNIIIEHLGVNEEPAEIDDENFKATLHADYEIMKRTKDILSIRFFLSFYQEGAALSDNLIDALTFDMKTGKVLELKDLFKEDVDYENILNSILNEKIKDLDFKLYEEYKGIEEEQGFYLTDNSIAVYYQEYIYTPHTYGPLILEIPFDEIKDILK